MASCGWDLGEAQAFITHLLGAYGGGGTRLGAGIQRQAALSQAEQATLSCRHHCICGGHTKEGACRVPGAGGHQESVVTEVMLELRFYLPGQEGGRVVRGRHGQGESTEGGINRKTC